MLLLDLSNIAFQTATKSCAAVKLNIHWDGKDKASVISPLGDFFGSSPGYHQYRAYPMGMTAGKCYSYFYMPYKAAKITLTNESSQSVAPLITVLSEPIAGDGRQ